MSRAWNVFGTDASRHLVCRSRAAAAALFRRAHAIRPLYTHVRTLLLYARVPEASYPPYLRSPNPPRRAPAAPTWPSARPDIILSLLPRGSRGSSSQRTPRRRGRFDNEHSRHTHVTDKTRGPNVSIGHAEQRNRPTVVDGKLESVGAGEAMPAAPEFVYFWFLSDKKNRYAQQLLTLITVR